MNQDQVSVERVIELNVRRESDTAWTPRRFLDTPNVRKLREGMEHERGLGIGRMVDRARPGVAYCRDFLSRNQAGIDDGNESACRETQFRCCDFHWRQIGDAVPVDENYS